MRYNNFVKASPAVASLILVSALVCALVTTNARSATPHSAAAKQVTFTHDIAPIAYQNCSTCHHAGEVAPFPLVTYRDFAKRAQQIAIVTQSHYMPPWKAAADCPSFQGERRLTSGQIALIQKWVDEGAPEGNPRDL